MKRKDFDKKLANEDIGIEELFNTSFMKKYTLFNSYEEIEEEVNSRATENADVEKLLKIIFEKKTKFRDIEEMKRKAIEEYLLHN